MHKSHSQGLWWRKALQKGIAVPHKGLGHRIKEGHKGTTPFLDIAKRHRAREGHKGRAPHKGSTKVLLQSSEDKERNAVHQQGGSTDFIRGMHNKNWEANYLCIFMIQESVCYAPSFIVSSANFIVLSTLVPQRKIIW